VVLENYQPTEFIDEKSYYDKARADYAVSFIELLKHTKGQWFGKPFKLMPWQEKIIRDLFGTIKENGYRQFNTAYISRIHAYLTRGNYYDSTIKEILETIYSDLKRLRTSPKIGSLLSVRTTIPNDYRYLVSGDYLIFYKIFESEKLVRIYHIYHGKENYLSKLKLHKHQSIYQTR